MILNNLFLIFNPNIINENIRNKISKIIFIFIISFYIFKIRRKFLNDFQKYNKNIPKISIFLAIYNKEKYLERSIGCLQKQTLKDIEIIAVNDASTDNSLSILREMSEKDSRIKIINNKKNSGSLFSRGMGILNSKGEYLMSLDPDDRYQGKSNLKYLYNIAKKLKVDIVSFLVFYLPYRKKSKCFCNYNKIIRQPELYQSLFKGNILNDFYITNKLIKREIFVNAFNIFKKYIYGEKWNYYEDNIWSILINKYANSSFFINKKIYYYYVNKYSTMMNRCNILELKNLLNRYEMYKIIFKTKEEEQYLVVGFNELLNVFEENINLVKINNEIKGKFINLFKFEIEIKAFNL
jgi:glycosyltransferase involved in cell wall biosynthesis